MTKNSAKIGTKVKTNMGIQRIGTIIPWIPLSRCTDGTYRIPQNQRELDTWVSVEWADGTVGYSSIVHLDKAS